MGRVVHPRIAVGVHADAAPAPPRARPRQRAGGHRPGRVEDDRSSAEEGNETVLQRTIAALLVLGGAISLSLLLFAYPRARTGIVLATLTGAAVVAGYWLRWSTRHHHTPQRSRTR
ncbi:hypothetical protein [Kineococcus sp. G2]|uniref:hypothetical protein n=1 Tax=Kineococcus sp. G2 TaxID=3127484 RepID=UPI00301C0609